MKKALVEFKKLVYLVDKYTKYKNRVDRTANRLVSRAMTFEQYRAVKAKKKQHNVFA